MLHLFDGTTNAIITESVELSIQFPHGHTQSVEFFCTLLDSSCLVVLRCEPKVTITEGAPRWVSKVRERYVTQRGSVGTWMGLGFNVCVVPTLTSVPVFWRERRTGVQRGREGTRDRDVT